MMEQGIEINLFEKTGKTLKETLEEERKAIAKEMIENIKRHFETSGFEETGKTNEGFTIFKRI